MVYLQSRNNKSNALNLKSGEGLEIAKTLAARADVVIENFRLGILEKMGLGWDLLSALNPSLTLCASPAIRRSTASARASANIGAAMGGLRYTTGDLESRLRHRYQHRRQPRLAARRDRRTDVAAAVKTGGGKGQIVDVSLLESVFNLMEALFRNTI